MNAEQFRAVSELFDKLAPLPVAEREAYLNQHCSDPDVRREVELLLAHDADQKLRTQHIHSAVGSSLKGLDAGPPDKIAGYRIQSEIGRGGMGVVYLAEQANPRRKVALKVIRPGLYSPETLRRFQHEAQALGRLQHPGIAQIVEAGTAKIAGVEQPYFAMEYVEGRPLHEYANQSKISIRDRLELFIRVCEAVQHAHQRGVIHRDLKPGNILVSDEATKRRSDEGMGRRSDEGMGRRSDEGECGRLVRNGGDEGRLGGGRADLQSKIQNPESKMESRSRTDETPMLPDAKADKTSAPPSVAPSLRRSVASPKILDFGVARVIDPDSHLTTVQTTVGQIVGTLAYMAPEQIEGGTAAIDTRIDIYALGVILYELLVGRLPHPGRGTSLAEVLRSIKEDDPPRLSTINRQFRGDLDTIVHKAMEKDPNRRYAAAVDLATDLQRFLRDEPILARPPTLAYQVYKFTRRNRALVAGGALAIGAMAVGTAATAWQAWRAINEQHRAEQASAEAQKKAAIAGAVSGFLSSLLEAGDLEKPESERDVRVSDVLTRAEKKLAEGSLADQPEVEFTLRSTLARMNEQLGRHEASAAHLERVIELRKQLHGPDDPEAITAMNDLATQWIGMQQLDKAEPYLRDVLAQSERVTGPKSMQTAGALSNLGQIYARKGNFADAFPLAQRAAEIFRDAGPAQDRLRALVLSNMGNMKRDGGELAAAEPYYREAIAITKHSPNPRSYRLALFNNNLALTLKLRGDFAAAEPLYQESLAIRRELLPPDHPDLAEVLNNLGALKRDQRDFAAAIEYFKEALVIAEKIFPPGYPNTSYLRRAVGLCLGKLDKFADAEPYLLQAYKDLAAVPELRAQADRTIPNLVDLYERWTAAQPSEERTRQLQEWKAKLPPSTSPTIVPGK